MSTLHEHRFLHSIMFSPFDAVSLCGVVGRFPVSGPYSSRVFPAFSTGSLLTLSFHRNFGLPLRRFPSIFISTTARMFSVSSLLLTYPNHYSILLLITIAISSSPASSKTSSFLQCSIKLPKAHHHCPSHYSHLCCCHTLFTFN